MSRGRRAAVIALATIGGFLLATAARAFSNAADLWNDDCDPRPVQGFRCIAILRPPHYSPWTYVGGGSVCVVLALLALAWAWRLLRAR